MAIILPLDLRIFRCRRCGAAVLPTPKGRMVAALVLELKRRGVGPEAIPTEKEQGWSIGETMESFQWALKRARQGHATRCLKRRLADETGAHGRADNAAGRPQGE